MMVDNMICLHILKVCYRHLFVPIVILLLSLFKSFFFFLLSLSIVVTMYKHKCLLFSALSIFTRVVLTVDTPERKMVKNDHFLVHLFVNASGKWISYGWSGWSGARLAKLVRILNLSEISHIFKSVRNQSYF